MNVSEAKALLLKAGYVVSKLDGPAKWQPHEDRTHAYYVVNVSDPAFTADVWRLPNGSWSGQACAGDHPMFKCGGLPEFAAKQKTRAAMMRLAAKARRE